jgi:glycosyltransferase involved in cell wall biosynthesis
MRLLHVIGTFKVGGAEMFIRNLILLQKEQGLEVELLLLSDSHNFIIQELRDKGIKVYSLHKEGKGYRNPLNVFMLIPWLKKYDLLHVHLVPEIYWIAMAKVFSFSSVKTITTVHFPKENLKNSIFVKFIERCSFRYGYNYVVACSKDSLVSLNKYSPKSNNISISNGVDIEKFHNAKPYTKQERFHLCENDYVVTMVSGLKHPKRHDLLIKALIYLPINVHIVFCGDGENKEKLYNLAKINDVIERVHFMGNCSDIDRIVNTSDINILLSEYEGLSLSSIEAMATGKPFVASNVNGLQSVVDGAGILVENEPHKVADAILKLLSDKELYKEVGTSCWERAKKYDIHEMANKYYWIYKQMLL